MPLFGSKKESKSQGSKSGYPTQQSAPAVPQQQYAPPPAAVPQGAPPPYSQYPQPAPGYAPAYGGVPPTNNLMNPYGAPPQQLPPTHPQAQPPPQTVVVRGGFDAGARFDGIAQPNVPPPPPGYAPNAAQMAVMQGQNVVMTQQQGNFLTGGSDGGYVWF